MAKLGSRFAEQSCSDLKDSAFLTGLLHDLGKYRDEFQEYLRNEREGSVETHHAIYGAASAFQQEWLGPAFAIAGHHAGLHDLNELQTLVGGSTYRTKKRLAVLVKRFEQELGEIPSRIIDPAFVENKLHCTDFYIRMLFSSLVDADFLDTEAHYKKTPRAPLELQAPELLQRLIAEKASKSSEGELNAIRNRIFQ